MIIGEGEIILHYLGALNLITDVCKREAERGDTTAEGWGAM